MNKFVVFFQKVLGPMIRLFMPMDIQGLENLPPEGALICPTHSSNWDPVMMVLALPVGYPIQAMAKESLFKIPLVGWYIRNAGAFPVARGSNDIGAVKKAITALRGGFNMIMFPEGTRVEHPGALPAKGGVAMIAIRTKAKMVPTYISHDIKLFRKTKVIFGTPYTPVYTGRNGTAEEVQQNADHVLKEAYALGGVSI